MGKEQRRADLVYEFLKEGELETRECIVGRTRIACVDRRHDGFFEIVRLGKKTMSVRFDLNGVIVGAVEVWEGGDRLIYDRISDYGDEREAEGISDKLIDVLEKALRSLRCHSDNESRRDLLQREQTSRGVGESIAHQGR